MKNHILGETCIAIWKALGEIYLKPPSSPDDGKQFQMTLRNFGIYYTALELLTEDMLICMPKQQWILVL